MAELKQTSEISYYQGWYGALVLKNGLKECGDLPLIEGTLADAKKLYPEIGAVYEIRSDAEGVNCFIMGP